MNHQRFNCIVVRSIVTAARDSLVDTSVYRDAVIHRTGEFDTAADRSGGRRPPSNPILTLGTVSGSACTTGPNGGRESTTATASYNGFDAVVSASGSTVGGSSTANTGGLATVTTTPVITSVSPATAAPGDPVVVNGQGFGSQQGSGRIQIVDNGVIWGGPGGQPLFAASWSDTQVTFTMPVKNSAGAQLTPGTTGAVSVTNAADLTSNSANLAVVTAVKWPVTFNSGVTTIGTTGNGFVQTTGSIDQAGNLTQHAGLGYQRVGVFTGFHAATVVRLYDTFGNVIDTFTSGPYGVGEAKIMPIPGQLRFRPMYVARFTRCRSSIFTTLSGPRPRQLSNGLNKTFRRSPRLRPQSWRPFEFPADGGSSRAAAAVITKIKRLSPR